jgi:hypothetical protein
MIFLFKIFDLDKNLKPRNKMRLQMCLIQTLELQGYQKFKLEAVKAFRKVSVGHLNLYTCNVNRLRSCDRLGEKRVVNLWMTHFFLASRHFDMVEGVIFNVRPGLELASFAQSLCFLRLYLMIDPTTIVDTWTGQIIKLEREIEFVSSES